MNSPAARNSSGLSAPSALGATHSPAPAARILLIEDRTGRAQLGAAALAALGYEVHLADDSRDALGRVFEEHFDAVVMDCHMPHLDGYAASMAIRAAETQRHPIIALAATHRGCDRQRCRAAGMDECLEKPIALARLAETLVALLPSAQCPYPHFPATGRAAVQTLAAAAAPAAFPPSGIDLASALERMGGDRELLAKLADSFRETAPATLDRLAAAAAGRDPTQTALLAHTLRGSVSLFSAHRSAVLLNLLEPAAMEENWSEVDRLLGELTADLLTVRTTLAQIFRASAP
jgi:CheY-like chemotaxis protein